MPVLPPEEEAGFVFALRKLNSANEIGKNMSFLVFRLFLMRV